MIFIFFTLAILTTHTGTQSGFNEKHLTARRGDEVIIPCTDHRNTTHVHFFQWFLTNDNKNKSVIIFHDVKTGGKRSSNDLESRSKTLRDFSLFIQSFRETDQGVYLCETCSKATGCIKGFETSLSLITEPPPVVTKRLYAAKGDNVSYPCPDGVEGSGRSISNGVQQFGEALQRKQLHPKASILLQDVRSEDAGIYSCWREDYSGQRQNLLMINLCVLTAFSSDVEPHSGVNSPECDRVAERETLEEGIEMIYSVLEIKRPEQDRVVVNEEECVYSRLQYAAQVD